MARLSVNVDHVATLRQARGIDEPDPVWAAILAEKAGADGIIVHLREDRRHIQDRDLEVLRQVVKGALNMEMAATEEMVGIAGRVGPDICTLVPEKRQELTTEGGLDVAGNLENIRAAVGGPPAVRHPGQPVHRPGQRADQGGPPGWGPGGGAAHRLLLQRPGRGRPAKALGRAGRLGPPGLAPGAQGGRGPRSELAATCTPCWPCPRSRSTPSATPSSPGRCSWAWSRRWARCWPWCARLCASARPSRPCGGCRSAA